MDITKANIASFSREYIKSLVEEELKSADLNLKGDGILTLVTSMCPMTGAWARA